MRPEWLPFNSVRTPSPRVLSGLAEALGISYDDLMQAAGYGPQPGDTAPSAPGAAKRYSNAHIVELLEQLQRDVSDIKAALADTEEVGEPGHD